MIRLSKSVFAVGGVVLAAGLITFTNPKAVHAVTAALVQVANTASNPAVTQSVGAQAGNMVNLTCDVYFVGPVGTCIRYAADGSASEFTVPSGESLVITAIDMQPFNDPVCPGSYNVELGTPNNVSVFLVLTTTNAQVTTHFTYPSGPVIGEGITPTWVGNQGTACHGGEFIKMYGYLTAA